MTARAQEPFTSYGNCTEKTYGFVSVNGEDHNISPTYCDATGFSEGLASVKLDGHAYGGLVFGRESDTLRN